jgi:hypothetical protein
MQTKSTTEDTEKKEDTDNCVFWGNSSRGYAIVSRGGLTLKKSDSACNTVGAGGDSVFSLFSVSSVVAYF